ncbi:MAG: division/cell wall cluster transcriptional repressor MraZ [Lachnospiraceae bacterium]|nr:division/cell wall cluster transcriptional repressor MraZ [Lachnospiraceae bacterium]
MFMSQYEHSIDAKGRTVIPSEFRDELGDSFVMTVGIDGCTYIYSMNEWENFEKKLHSISMNTRENRMIKRAFLGQSKVLVPDKQGRIVVPQNLRKVGGFKDELVFVGIGDKIEVWDKERYETVNAIPFDDFGFSDGEVMNKSMSEMMSSVSGEII